ncbi:hypothetical protein G6F65_021033 [Rhizopus arrhizus]|nr:hypothetical protein G6F65_021033 [Rhizopus arrhizus]
MASDISPAFAVLSQQIARGHAHVVEVDFRQAQHAAADDVQTPDGDALEIIGHQEQGNAIVPLVALRGPDGQHDVVVGRIRAAGEHLLAVDQPIIAVAPRARGQRRRIRPGTGLSEAER